MKISHFFHIFNDFLSISARILTGIPHLSQTLLLISSEFPLNLNEMKKFEKNRNFLRFSKNAIFRKNRKKCDFSEKSQIFQKMRFFSKNADFPKNAIFRKNRKKNIFRKNREKCEKAKNLINFFFLEVPVDSVDFQPSFDKIDDVILLDDQAEEVLLDFLYHDPIALHGFLMISHHLP